MQEEGKDPQEQEGRGSRKQMLVLPVFCFGCFHLPAGGPPYSNGCALLQFLIQRHFHLQLLCHMKLVLSPCQLEAPTGELLCPIEKVFQASWFGSEFGFGLVRQIQLDNGVWQIQSDSVAFQIWLDIAVW